MSSGLHHHALHAIGRAIVDGDRPAGSVMLVDRLSVELGVSRSVIREAVRVLASLGMVRSTQRLGTTVQPVQCWNTLDPLIIRWRLLGPGRGAQLRSLNELRAAVEPAAAELAATWAPETVRTELVDLAARMRARGEAGDLTTFLDLDIRFHELVLRGSGNEMFAHLHASVAEILAGRTRAGLMPSRPHEQALNWHQEVAESIARSRPARARAAMDRIMRRTLAETAPAWTDAPRVFDDAGDPSSRPGGVDQNAPATKKITRDRTKPQAPTSA
ncbi:GntR family transcriptional regulator [Tersicoccus phoenicis]|uniref:GntR family transcriptional regulator n=1 Tax=Tersicoccus phoenicis TaxID=554083 RepID=A0A1R1LFM6_9MICC|nr:FCD domain-containing protein [Tersicoccus phoenicis]OMH26332.1 GntR family transcriptional regulator [Tersicoccus phoenicis]